MSLHTEHLAALPRDFASLTDAHLVVEGQRWPVHKTILARYSGHARSLLSAIEDGEVAPPAAPADLAAALSAPLAGASPPEVTAFLRLLYSITSARRVVEALCTAHHDAGAEEVVFDFSLEPALKLAQAYDCPEVFQLCEAALLREPVLQLAVLMAPLRWLLLLDEYAHLGGFQQARAVALCHLSAKFAALQGDPLLPRLGHGTLVEVVRLLGARLDGLARGGGHARSATDRAVQRFSALAQEVAAPYCPNPAHPSAFVTHWAVATTSHSIKLTWVRDGGSPAAAAPAAAPPAEPAQHDVPPAGAQLQALVAALAAAILQQPQPAQVVQPVLLMPQIQVLALPQQPAAAPVGAPAGPPPAAPHPAQRRSRSHGGAPAPASTSGSSEAPGRDEADSASSAPPPRTASHSPARSAGPGTAPRGKRSHRFTPY